MAQQVITRITDDMNPEVEADYTVPFGIDGRTYEVDLTDDNKSRLMEILKPFIDRARTVKRSRDLKPIPLTVAPKPEKKLATPADLEVGFEDPEPYSTDDTIGQDDDVTYPAEEAAPKKSSKIRAIAERLAATEAPVVTKVPIKADAKTMRAWARSQGIEVSPRGKLKPEVVAAFEAAH